MKQVYDEHKSNNRKVSQSNEFVVAPYATEFSLHELKISEYMIADTRKIDIQLIASNMNKVFKFSPSELAHILGTSTSRIVTDANKLAKNITEKRIIEHRLDENNEILDFAYVPLVTLAKYENAIFEFHLNCYILKYFVDLDGNFTEYYLDHLLCMNSPYAIKIYKLLLMHKNKYRNSPCIFTVNELKEQCGIVDKYNLYPDFKRRVIDPSIKQINEKTDLIIEYSEIKYGRKVEKLLFNFKHKKQSINVTEKPEIQVNNSPIIKAIEIEKEEENVVIDKILGIKVNDVSNKTKLWLNNIILTKGVDFIKCSINYAIDKATTNFEKYLIDTIINNWAELDIKKLESKRQVEKKEKQNKQVALEEKNKQKELDNANKSELEHLFLKLTDNEQMKYSDLANNILTKYPKKLSYCDAVTLTYSVFAVSNGRYYNKNVEVFISKILNQSLNVNDYLC